MTRPDSIGKVGLKEHLNNTAPKHKNKAYDDFIEMLDNKASVAYMARAFGVSRHTIYKWLMTLEKVL